MPPCNQHRRSFTWPRPPDCLIIGTAFLPPLLLASHPPQLLLQLRQRSASRSGLSGEDAAAQLDLVTRLVPGWVTEVTAAGQQLAGLTTNVRLNRRLPWNEARAKLMAGAAEARANQAAAAAARAADAAAAADEASAAAAADQQQQQEDGGAAQTAAASREEGMLVVVVDEAKAAQLGQQGLPGKGNRLAAAAAAVRAAAGGSAGGGSSGSKPNAAATRQQRLAALGMFDKGPGSSSSSISAAKAAGGQGGGLAACLAFTAPAVTPGGAP